MIHYWNNYCLLGFPKSSPHYFLLQFSLQVRPLKMSLLNKERELSNIFFSPTQLFFSPLNISHFFHSFFLLFFSLFSHFFIISVVGTAVQPRLMRHWSLFSKCKELGWNSRFLALLAFRSSTEPSENPGVVVVWGCDSLVANVYGPRTFGPQLIGPLDKQSPTIQPWTKIRSPWTNGP